MEENKKQEEEEEEEVEEGKGKEEEEQAGKKKKIPPAKVSDIVRLHSTYSCLNVFVCRHYFISGTEESCHNSYLLYGFNTLLV